MSDTGWLMLANARKFHYFDEDRRSLCGRWMIFSNGGVHGMEQILGDKPQRDDCKACWRKRKDQQQTPAPEGEG